MRKLYPSDIVANCKPVTDFKFYCVYFLIQNSRIVYVGYSTNFGSRISAHMNSEKVFDSYYLIRCETEKEALELEKYYIQTINPYFNGSYCDKSKSHKKDIVIKEYQPKVKHYFGKRKHEIVLVDNIKDEVQTITEQTTQVIEKHEATSLPILEYINKVKPINVEPLIDNVENVKIDFKIPKNSYMKKNDGYYYFSLSSEVYRAKSTIETYIIKGIIYNPVGIFGSMDSIID